MNREKIIEEIQQILNVLADRRTRGVPSYLTSVRKAVETLITLRLSEYVTFLDQQGLVVFDKKKNTLELTDAGDGVMGGTWSPAILEALSLHFASALGVPPEPAPPPPRAPEPPAAAPAPAVESSRPTPSRTPPAAVDERRRPAPTPGWAPAAEPEEPPAPRVAAPRPAAPAPAAIFFANVIISPFVI